MEYKRLSDKKPVDVDVVEYVHRFFLNNPGAKVAVGTDSKYKANSTKLVYATCIALFYPGSDGHNKGAHIIYSIERLYRRIELFERLWDEVDRSRILAETLKEELGIDPEIHIDINPKKDFKSNVAYQPAIGMLKGMGYIVHAKPCAPAATCAADLLVNQKVRMSKKERRRWKAA